MRPLEKINRNPTNPANTAKAAVVVADVIVAVATGAAAVAADVAAVVVEAIATAADPVAINRALLGRAQARSSIFQNKPAQQIQRLLRSHVLERFAVVRIIHLFRQQPVRPRQPDKNRPYRLFITPTGRPGDARH